MKRFRVDVFSDTAMKYRVGSVTVEAHSSDDALQEVATWVKFESAPAFMATKLTTGKRQRLMISGRNQ